MKTPSERRTLLNFMYSVREILDNVSDAASILFNEEMRSVFRAAWNDSRGNVENLLPEIERLDNGEGDDRQIRNTGLYGKQLDMKLLGFFDSYDDYVSNGGAKRLKKAIKWAKAILESLSSVIPGVEFLKELLEAAEMGVENALEN